MYGPMRESHFIIFKAAWFWPIKTSIEHKSTLGNLKCTTYVLQKHHHDKNKSDKKKYAPCTQKNKYI